SESLAVHRVLTSFPTRRSSDLHDEHLVGIALLDGDLPTRGQRPVDGRVWQRHIEGYAVVLGRERFQIGSDLVGGVTVGSHAVSANQHQVHQSLLHQVSARVVDNNGMWHAVGAELESGERGTLIARSRLVHPYV